MYKTVQKAVATVATVIVLGAPVASAESQPENQANPTSQNTPSAEYKPFFIENQPWKNSNDVNNTEIAGGTVVRVTDASTDGFNVTVNNFSSISKAPLGRITITAPNGDVAATLEPVMPLRDGSTIPVNYTIEGNQITAQYQRSIEPEEILLVTTYDAAGCAIGVLGTVAGVALGAAALLSTPLSGPAGPLTAFGVTTGTGAAIAETGRECTEGN